MKIRLNSKFYSPDAVKEAAKDFNEICDCKILNDKMEIILTQKKATDEPLAEEFCNYVLGLMKNQEMI